MTNGNGATKRVTHDRAPRRATSDKCNQARTDGAQRARDMIRTAFEREVPTKQGVVVVIDLTFLNRILPNPNRVEVPATYEGGHCAKAYRDGFKTVCGQLRESVVLLFGAKNKDVRGTKKDQWKLDRESLPEILELVGGKSSAVEAEAAVEA